MEKGYLMPSTASIHGSPYSQQMVYKMDVLLQVKVKYRVLHTKVIISRPTASPESADKSPAS